LGFSSAGSVTHHLRKALDRLGLRSRVELIRVTSQWAAAITGPTTPSIAPRGYPELTAAERGITQLVIEGCSNREIAKRRRVSERTVANQLASIYRKLGSEDRHELVCLLSAR